MLRFLGRLFPDDTPLLASIDEHEAWIKKHSAGQGFERLRALLELWAARFASIGVVAANSLFLWLLFRIGRDLHREGDPIGQLIVYGVFLYAIPGLVYSLRYGRRLRARILHSTAIRIAGTSTRAASGSAPVAAPALVARDDLARAGRLIDRGDPEEGLRLLERVPVSTRALQFRAVALLKLGRKEDAAPVAHEVLRRTDAPVRSVVEAALILQQCGSQAEAFAAAARALEAGPSDRALFAARSAATVLNDAQVWERLAALCAKAKAAGAATELVRLTHYVALSATKPFDEMTAMLDEVFDCNDCKSPDPPFWRAQRRVRTGEFDGARRDFAKARRRGGRAPDVDYGEAMLLRSRKRRGRKSQLDDEHTVLDVRPRSDQISVGVCVTDLVTRVLFASA